MSISNSKSLKCSNIHQIVQISKNSHYSKTRLHDMHAKIELIHKLNNNFLSRPKHPSLFKKSRIPKKKKLVKNPITRIDLQKHLDMQKQSNNMENRFIQKAWRKIFIFIFIFNKTKIL